GPDSGEASASAPALSELVPTAAMTATASTRLARDVPCLFASGSCMIGPAPRSRTRCSGSLSLSGSAASRSYIVTRSARNDKPWRGGGLNEIPLHFPYQRVALRRVEGRAPSVSHLPFRG